MAPSLAPLPSAPMMTALVLSGPGDNAPLGDIIRVAATSPRMLGTVMLPHIEVDRVGYHAFINIGCYEGLPSRDLELM